MSKLYRSAIIALFLISAHVFVPPAQAHPMGNFTINHYAGMRVSSREIVIDYVLDMAEIPAFQEISAMDANENGRADPEETASFRPAQCEKIQAGLELRANNRQLPLTLTASEIEFPPGQGGLSTLRLTCTYKAIIPESATGVVPGEFENHAYAARLGWREIVVTAEGVALQGDFATASLSNRLTSYPQDLLSSPLDQRQVTFEILPAGGTGPVNVPSSVQVSNPLTENRNDAFTRLILLEEINLPTLLFALAIAFIWGALHALTPGHGKTIVGVYLVGSRGTAKHALYLGLATTITHTAGVFALGLVTLFAAHFILPEKLFPWLSFLSGLLVVGIGLNLVIGRLRTAFNRQRSVVSHRSLAHSHDHHQAHPHGYEHPHDHDHDHDHDHIPGGHSHLPPGADGAPVTWRSLLALGISGGILPCPSALVVMLSAVALERIGLGMALVLAFSLGLAGVLTGIGLMFVYAGRLFERVPLQGRVIHLLPAASALFIALVGLGITARALVEIGILKL